MQPVASLRLGDRYTLTERIAVGGMGEVWKARDDVLRRTVAIKVLGQQFLESHEFASRFRAEARHAASLAHPGVAGVYDYAEDDDGAYLVMEFVPGEPLSALLARTPVPPLTTTLSILAQTAEALSAAHAAEIIHRDVKPGNLMITPDGAVKVTDFGIARAADGIPLTAAGQTVGTPQYMSPEQASGGSIGPASDIYSLGVIGYEALAGRRPFNDTSPLALAMAHVNAVPPPLPDTVPEDVRALIARAMAKNPDDRPRTATDFAGELRALQMRLTPPPVLAPGMAPGPAPDPSFPATLADVDTAPTQHLPVGGVAVGSPNLVIDKRSVAASPRRRRGPLVAAIVVLAACGLLVALARRDSGRTLELSDEAASITSVATSIPVEPASAAPTTTVAPTVSVDPAAYIGKSAAEARAMLEALGLQVQPPASTETDESEVLVADVQPSGDVPAGSIVTLTFDTGDDGGGGDGKPEKPGNGKGKDKDD